MTAASLALHLIFFVTSTVTVVIGSTTLITIPVLLQFGIEPRTAVATNMFALAMLNAGGFLPFLRTPAIDRTRAPLLTGLTLVGSAAGAFLLFAVPAKWMTLIIPVAMIAVLILLLLQPQEGPHSDGPSSMIRAGTGYAVMTLLAVYGGFLSGGYATLITGAGMVFFHYSFFRAMAMSKMMNLASGLIAVAIFARNGIVDWPLAITLGAVSFVGGLIGSHWAQRMPVLLLRRIFLIAVAVLAAKTLIFDVPWHELMPIS
jgi:uncharacterized protein